MSFRLDPKPKGNVIVKSITVDSEDRIEPAAQKFFDSELDEASPYFIKGVNVYEVINAQFEGGPPAYIRYIENPSIDPFDL